MADRRATDWFIPLADPASATAHVYALPQAGAGCAAFAGLADLLAPDLAVWGLNLPGRAARFAEPPCVALPALLDALAPELGRRRPWLLFGYCSGALLAFLLTRRLRSAGLPGPAALIVASSTAPDETWPPADLHTLPPEEFWREIIGYGGIHGTVAAQPDFREIFEPALRADYQLLAGYRYTENPPLDVPLVVLAGNRDPVLSEARACAWRRHCAGPVRVRALAGGHWLMDDALPALAGTLREYAP